MMKKMFLSIFLSILLAMPSASCAVNLEAMSFSDLVELRRQIELELMSRKDWKEVLVQEGIYEVGVDIPAGHYTILAADGTFTHVKYGNRRKTDEADIHIGSTNFRDEYLYSPHMSRYDMYKDKVQADIDMETGSYFAVRSSACVLIPYTGKPYFDFAGDDGFTKVSATPSPTPSPSPIPSLSPSTSPYQYLGYETFDYQKAARYPDEYRGTSVLIEGRAVQVLRSKSNGYDIRLSTKGNYDDIVYICIDSSAAPDAKILEDDMLRIKGYMMGEYTYTSTTDRKITLPIAFADSVEIIGIQ